MKKIIGILCVALVFGMLINVSKVDAATALQEEAANQFNALGIMKGRDDGDLALDSTITRAEIATLILRVTSQEDVEVKGLDKVTHKDIVGHWAEENIRKVIKLGYMKGYTDEMYGPNEPITYGEIVTLALRLVGEEKNIEGEWPVAQIEKAKSISLLKGETSYEKEKFVEKATRGLVAKILYDTMILNTNMY